MGPSESVGVMVGDDGGDLGDAAQRQPCAALHAPQEPRVVRMWPGARGSQSAEGVERLELVDPSVRWNTTTYRSTILRMPVDSRDRMYRHWLIRRSELARRKVRYMPPLLAQSW